MSQRRGSSDHSSSVQWMLTQPSTFKAGFLRRKEGTPFVKWNQRYIILTTKTLHVFDNETAMIPREIIHLQRFTGVQRYESKSRNAPWAFMLNPFVKSHASCKFSCATDLERAQWMMAMKRTIIDRQFGEHLLKDSGISTCDEETYALIEGFGTGETIHDGTINESIENQNDDDKLYDSLEDITAPVRVSGSSCSSGFSDINLNQRVSDVSGISGSEVSRASSVSRSSGVSDCSTLPVVKSIPTMSCRSTVTISGVDYDVPRLTCDVKVTTDIHASLSDTTVPLYVNLPSQEPDYEYLSPSLPMKPTLEELCTVTDDSVTAKELSEKLKDKTPGCYLIRKSRSTKGKVLSCRGHEKCVKQFKIFTNPTDGSVSLDNSKTFPNIEALLQGYSKDMALPVTESDAPLHLDRGIYDGDYESLE